MVDSISKTPISEATAALIAADAFGTDVTLTGFTECTEGWFNAAYRLTMSDGRQGVLKVAPPPDVTVLTYEHDIMATEVAGLRLVRERTTAPVPAVLWSDTSCRHVPSALFVMETCRGRLLSELRPTLDTAQQQFVDAQLAGHLRQINDITNPTFGLQAPSARAFGTWSEAFTALFDDLLADGAVANVELPLPYEQLKTFVRENEAVLDEVTEARFVHWDLFDPNVFVDPETLAVTGLIDFERALWADPLMEAQFLTRRGDEAFLEAYGAPLFDASGAQRRRLLYDLYLYLIIVIENSYRHYPGDEIVTYGRTRLAVTLERLGLTN